MSKNLTEVDEYTANVTVPEGGDARTALSVETPFQALANRSLNAKNRLDGHDTKLAAIPMAVIDARFEAGNQDGTMKVSPAGNDGWQDVLSETGLATPAVGDRIIVEAYGEGSLGGPNSLERFDWRILIDDGSDNVIAQAQRMMRETGTGASGYEHDLAPVALSGQFVVSSAVAHTVKLQIRRFVAAAFTTGVAENTGATHNCWINSLLLRSL